MDIIWSRTYVSGIKKTIPSLNACQELEGNLKALFERDRKDTCPNIHCSDPLQTSYRLLCCQD